MYLIILYQKLVNLKCEILQVNESFKKLTLPFQHDFTKIKDRRFIFTTVIIAGRNLSGI